MCSLQLLKIPSCRPHDIHLLLSIQSNYNRISITPFGSPPSAYSDSKTTTIRDAWLALENKISHCTTPIIISLVILGEAIIRDNLHVASMFIHTCSCWCRRFYFVKHKLLCYLITKQQLHHCHVPATMKKPHLMSRWLHRFHALTSYLLTCHSQTISTF